jgi:putative endonuclease
VDANRRIFLWTTLFIFYISHSANTIYIGQTSNLIQRFYSHNIFGKDWTKRFRPWVVIYTEWFADKREASLREKQLKGGKGREWIWDKIKNELPTAGFISA